MIRYASAAIIMVCTFSTYVFSQDNSPLKFNVIPPAPEAASLGKFIDMPVSTYTGLPKIEVPVYELKSYQLSLPISLSYHASGIKWEEIPSWVGAGWALNAGGLVSRTIRGRNDEDPTFGYLANTPNGTYNVGDFFNADGSINYSNYNYVLPSGVCGPLPTDNYLTMLYAAKGGLDLEPDLFFFSLPDGQSGKFAFTRNRQTKMIPDQYADIDTDMNFNEWMITGLDGTRYYFDKQEITQNYSTCQEIANGPETYTIPNVIAPSTWKLSKIVSQDGNDSIWFEYVDETISYQATTSTTRYDRTAGSAAVPGSSDCLNFTTVGSKRLSKIYNKAGYRIEFIANTNRADLAGAKLLDEIKIYYKDTFLKKQVLSISGGTLPVLNEVQEFFDDASTTNNKPSYQFTYYDYGAFAPAYSRTSNNLDHWGYFNGTLGEFNQNNVPAVIYQNVYYAGANRESDLAACRWMTLKDVTYPTGGKTTYQYELHDFTNIPTFTDIVYAPALEEIESVQLGIVNNPGVSYTESVNFSLPANTQVVIFFEIPAIPGGGIPPNGCNASLSKAGDPSFTTMQFLSGSGQTASATIQTFTAGNYTLAAEFTPSMFNWGSEVNLSTLQFFVKIYKVISLQERMENNALKGGGLRVKKIISEGDQTLTKTLVYTNEDNTLTSGKLASFPLYAYINTFNNANMVGPTCIIDATGEALIRTRATGAPLAVNQGSHVAYDFVREYYGDLNNNNGYTTYQYTNTPDVVNNLYPFVPGNSVAYKNGLLLKKRDYTSTNKLVQSVENEYTYLPNNLIVEGLKVIISSNSPCIKCENRAFGGNVYGETSEKVQLTKTTTREYDMTYDSYIETAATYNYNSFDQLVTKKDLVSNLPNKKRYTTFEYHGVMHNKPTYERTFYANDALGNVEPISGLFKNYLSSKVADVYLAEPTPGVYANTSLAFSNWALRLRFTQLDTEDNVLTFKKENDPAPISIIWGYDKLFPTAQIINANYDQVAYTSFENGSNDGNWLFTASPSTEKKTGDKSHALNQSISINGLNTTTKYVLSYWAKGNPALNVTPESTADDPDPGFHNWRYYERVISNVTTFTLSGSGTIYIDELRLYPVGARMTTYTYDVKTGMTSSTDENNTTTHYQYNQRQQLEFILDFERNLLKKNEYHYNREN